MACFSWFHWAYILYDICWRIDQLFLNSNIFTYIYECSEIPFSFQFLFSQSLNISGQMQIEMLYYEVSNFIFYRRFLFDFSPTIQDSSLFDEPFHTTAISLFSTIVNLLLFMPLYWVSYISEEAQYKCGWNIPYCVF